jgi:hypothetical protein
MIALLMLYRRSTTDVQEYLHHGPEAPCYEDTLPYVPVRNIRSREMARTRFLSSRRALARGAWFVNDAFLRVTLRGLKPGG